MKSLHLTPKEYHTRCRQCGGPVWYRVYGAGVLISPEVLHVDPALCAAYVAQRREAVRQRRQFEQLRADPDYMAWVYLR